jgi:hypothetical protein
VSSSDRKSSESDREDKKGIIYLCQVTPCFWFLCLFHFTTLLQLQCYNCLVELYEIKLNVSVLISRQREFGQQ